MAHTHINIYKDSMNVDIPNVALVLGDNLFSRNMHIETKMVYIYDDSLELIMDYSIDQGESWSNEFMIDTSHNNVDYSYSWNILNEFGWNYIESLIIRLYAIAGDISSDTLYVSNVSVANLAGDYNYSPSEEIGLKANDIEILVSSFNEIGEEIAEVDIGPSNGIAPMLTISPDGIIDFEDLATFTQMWYWSSDHFSNIDTVNSNFILNNENQFSFGLFNNNSNSDENLYPIEVTYNNEMNLAGFELKIEYDMENIEVSSFSLNSNNLDIYNELFLLQKHNTKNGSYVVSAWSKKDNLISFHNIKATAFVNRKNENEFIFPFKIFFLPYFSANEVGTSIHSVLNLDMTAVIANDISLSNNYPNPFNPTTKINFSINKPTFVVVNVFDILGRNIQTLISDYLQPGLKTISWDGRNYNGEDMGAGMYFYQLKANGTTLTKKMVLLK